MSKKAFVIILVVLVGASLALPATSHARWHGWGWYGPVAFGGGFLLGIALARPYYYTPAPVYVYPPPAVIYAPLPPPVYVPNQVYAYPDPAVAAGPQSDPLPSGQWVEVPGQYVNGKWVPPHKAWVPDNS